MVASFACTKKATLFLMALKKDVQCMDPENPESTGLLHFYQEKHPDKDQMIWKFLTADQYEANKDALPDICFASRHPIHKLSDYIKNIQAGFEGLNEDSEFKNLPDLAKLLPEVQMVDDAMNHESQTTNTGSNIPADRPLYYAFSEEHKVIATDCEAFDGDQPWDLNPVVYYRLKKPVQKIDKLPMILLKDLFEVADQEDAQISFVVKSANINLRETDALEISDEKTQALLQSVKGFTPQEDEQILQQLDIQMSTRFNGIQIVDLAATQFEMTMDLFREESSLRAMDIRAIEIRSELLVKFNKVFC